MEDTKKVYVYKLHEETLGDTEVVLYNYAGESEFLDDDEIDQDYLISTAKYE